MSLAPIFHHLSDRDDFAADHWTDVPKRQVNSLDDALRNTSGIMTGPITLGTLRTSLVLGFRLIVQAATLIIVARMLGPDQFGIFAGIASLGLILGTLASFGIHLLMLGEASNNPQHRDVVLLYAIPLTLAGSCVSFLIFLLTSLGTAHEHGIAIWALLAIGIAEIVLQPFFVLMSIEHHALGFVVRAQLMQLAPIGLRLMMAIFVLKLAPIDPLELYASTYLAVALLTLALGYALLPAPWPRPQLWRLPLQPELRKASGYAAMNFTKVAPAELDKALAIKLLPIDMASLYAASARVVGAIIVPVTAMTLAALPRLFRNDRTDILQRQMFGAALIYSILLMAVMWYVAPIFELIFGHDYNGISELIRYLCLAIPGMALRMITGNALMAAGLTWLRVGCESLGIAVLLILSIMLTSKYGSTGIAFALVFSEWSMALSGALLLRKYRRATAEGLTNQ